MADGHFQDVELLRRELAILVLEWAGKSVKDDPDGPMSTALTRAVGDAARGAVAEQHQTLTAEAADRIAEALERRRQADGVFVLRLRAWSIGLIVVVIGALLALTFLLGASTARPETPLSAEPSGLATPVAPLAPSVDTPAQAPLTRHEPAAQPVVRPQKPSTRVAAPPVTRSPARELGRPAPANDEGTRTAQPVGSAPPAPTGQTATPKP